MIASGAVVASVPALPGGMAASAPVPPRSTSAGQCHHADDFAPREGLGADVCETGDGLFKVRTASGAHPPDASATMVPLMRQHFVQSNAMVSNRAAEHGGDLSPRVACDSGGRPAGRVMRSSHDNDDIGAIDQAVARQGRRITGQANVVYWDDGGCGGGVAYGSGDTRPGVENTAEIDGTR
ncbi:hypothetical protein [Saccharothrix texasensis]|uniref:Uncharacterized protein n=1 Tax=Saccharothrix texasensis TaxID=103734 RepID=A0A3N1HI11_9PSEU|nr:hypothetical protein [Saccharothrix texasensis]ROP42091.1 hypothetical protein EDD40_7584 [Saccharothrix texasensis]